LRLNFVTKNSEQAVMQGLASDKVYCTHNNRQHIFKFSGRVCLKMLVLRTPCCGFWYPRLRTTGMMDNTKRRDGRAGGPCFQFENMNLQRAGGLH